MRERKWNGVENERKWAAYKDIMIAMAWIQYENTIHWVCHSIVSARCVCLYWIFLSKTSGLFGCSVRFVRWVFLSETMVLIFIYIFFPIGNDDALKRPYACRSNTIPNAHMRTSPWHTTKQRPKWKKNDENISTKQQPQQQ